MSETKKSHLQGSGTSSIDAELSVTPDTTLIYGQKFYLNVILKANTGNLPVGYFINITAKVDSGITIAPPTSRAVTSGHENSINSGLYSIVIDGYDENTIKNSQVSFTIALNNGSNNIYNKNFSYNVKKILPYTLQLLPDKPVCVIPKKYSAPTQQDPKDRYVLYKTQLLEDTGSSGKKTPITNVLVHITSKHGDDFSKNIIITSHPKLGLQPTIYSPTIENGKTFIRLMSDSHDGTIKFRVYPNNKPKDGNSKANYKPILLSLGV
ncbi:hypothetical protein WDV76_10580 [Xenorhabdus griffiniae]|uniref:hypothetical protein n=1 Tax=Xenorhabdus griffiniae TaxID=351672 RepID=UPI0030CC233B